MRKCITIVIIPIENLKNLHLKIQVLWYSICSKLMLWLTLPCLKFLQSRPCLPIPWEPSPGQLLPLASLQITDYRQKAIDNKKLVWSMYTLQLQSIRKSKLRYRCEIMALIYSYTFLPESQNIIINNYIVVKSWGRY